MLSRRVLKIIAGVAQVLQFSTLREQHEQRLRLEVTTQNLERAHTKLQQLDEFKSRFFANMTHELRTPLAMVLTPLELMMQGEMGAFSEAQRSSLSTMYRSALKLLKLINDLLDLSRLEESRLRLDVKEQDLVAQLRGLVEQTEVLAQPQAASPSPSRASRAAVHHLVRRGAAGAGLRQPALQRHQVHAAERARHGARCATSSTTSRWWSPTTARASRPTGPSRSSSASTRWTWPTGGPHGGTGIGLALARELVMLHGGTIRAESDGQSGARFTVTLPKGRGHFRPEALAAPRAAGAAPAGEPGLDWAVQLAARSEFRLLDIEEATERRVVERDTDEEARPYTAVVVEDHPHIIQLVHMSLRRQFKVLTAPDGLKGLELDPPRAPEPGGHRPHDAGHRRAGAHPAAPRGADHPPHPHHHAHGARRARRPGEGAGDRASAPTSPSPSRRRSCSPRPASWSRPRSRPPTWC